MGLQHCATFAAQGLRLKDVTTFNLAQFMTRSISVFVLKLKRLYQMPLQLMSLNQDKRTIDILVNTQGHKYEGFECETKDGYILNMHRVVNRATFDVVYFQHGVCDTATSWIAQGNRGPAF
jgi:hypothetical protein